MHNEIRIIGGDWKRTRLKVLDKPGLRPTPDRVRETLFNWLGQDLAGWRCLDAFAGSGALGLEAASRGAAEVLLCEQDSTLVVQLEKIRSQLQAQAVHIRRGDGLAALQQLSLGSMDVIFLDPPFDGKWIEPCLRAAPTKLKATGFVYLEAPSNWTDALLEPFGLRVHRHLKAGAVHAHLLCAA